MRKLYYLGKPDDGFGWGVANTNIVRALAEFCEVSVDVTDRREFDAPVFVPIADHQLNARQVWAPRLLGYCFTELPLGIEARRNARKYHVLFAGSTWNVQRLAEAGIMSEVLHQGIDFERFKVQPPSERKGFVVFSGGKYEFRKGQDYVAAAMKHFMAARPDVVLLAAWHNQWPQSRATMQHSWLINCEQPMMDLPDDRVFQLPAMSNRATPSVYGAAHIGVFPNRCEAGTNLVMCEFMACGRPVIATCATGHADVFAADESSGHSAYLLDRGTYDPAHWFNCNVSDIIARLEHAYHHREQLAERGLACRKLVEKFTWRACAAKIAQAAFPGSEFRPRPVQDREIEEPALASQ